MTLSTATQTVSLRVNSTLSLTIIAAYCTELGQVIGTCIQEVITRLTVIGERTEANAKLIQARLILDFVSQLASRMELTTDTGSFLGKLLDLVGKNKALLTKQELKVWTNVLDFIRRRSSDEGLINTIRSLQS